MISVELPDRRRIAVEDDGDPNGYPVFLLHGMPGSRTGPKPRLNSSIFMPEAGRDIRLISYDRPGYGASTRLAGRRVADAAADVRAVADHLGLHRFAVVGRSGGAPHALACAALLGSRIDAVAAMVSLAPCDAPGLDWFGGMGNGNQRKFRDIHRDPDAVHAELRDLAKRVKADPGAVLPSIDEDLTDADRAMLANYDTLKALGTSYAEAYRNGVSGHLDDMVALTDPAGWGFELDEIYAPILLWHGQRDLFSPPDHARWLRNRLADRHPDVDLDARAGHFEAIKRLPEVILWAANHGKVRRPPLTAWTGRRAG